jgi:hypothetical protein
MKPIINLAFVDDWELRGNGSGDIEQLQFRPMRELARIYNENGIRGSFNAEMMQQLTFRKFQNEHEELKKLADEWDAIVRETFSQGHDVQLHIHPQWHSARYENGEWRLSSDWSILNYEADLVYEMIRAGKEYLENLLCPVDANYRCVSFRSGAWCIAPSPFMLNLLVRLGLVFDMSIVGGLRFHTRNIEMDYTNCEETFSPYYPVMTDARRVSHQREAIICVPTHQFHSSRRRLFTYQLGKVSQKLSERLPSAAGQRKSRATSNDYAEWAEVKRQSLPAFVFKGVLAKYWTGQHFISDLSKLNYSLMREMLADIRRRALGLNVPEVPVVLECHTKDIHDFAHIKRFVLDASQADDIRCVTLTELARGFQSGKFYVRTRTNEGA